MSNLREDLRIQVEDYVQTGKTRRPYSTLGDSGSEESRELRKLTFVSAQQAQLQVIHDVKQSRGPILNNL